MQIVIVDDEVLVLETIRLGWPDPADRITTFTSFEALKPLLYSRDFAGVDCVILDLNLPDASGSQVLAEIRRISDVPIIMLSGWGDAEFRAELINRGIDDYVLKPSSTRELHARANRLVNRKSPGPAADAAGPVCIGPVEYVPMDRLLRAGEAHTDLTHAEARLLDALIAAAGKPVSRDDLYRQAFGRAYRDGEKVLETYISRVRQKLDALADGAGEGLQTARGIGYRLAVRAA